MPPPPPDAQSHPAQDQLSPLLSWIGWCTISGTVIAVEPPYSATRPTNWFVLALKIAVVVCLFPLLLGIALAFVVAVNIFFLLHFSPHNRPQWRPSLGLGWLWERFFGPPKQITVRDVRLREPSGNERLIRIRGDLLSGNVQAGDEIEVHGLNQKGTLLFYWGHNKRIGSKIIVTRK